MFEDLFRQVRLTIQERIAQIKKRLASYAIAGVLMAAAFFFALLTAYLALLYIMDPVLAAGLLFLVLLAAGVGALYVGREAAAPKRLRKLEGTAAESVAKPNGVLTPTGLPLLQTAISNDADRIAVAPHRLC
jgi:hypothetical protein